MTIFLPAAALWRQAILYRFCRRLALPIVSFIIFAFDDCFNGRLSPFSPFDNLTRDIIENIGSITSIENRSVGE